MKKVLFVFFAGLFLTACEGTTPPQWWNPSGKYADQQPVEHKTTKTASPAKKTTPAAVKVAPAATVTQPKTTVIKVEEDVFIPIEENVVIVEELPIPSVLSEED